MRFLEFFGICAIAFCVFGLIVSWRNFFCIRRRSRAYQKALTQIAWLGWSGAFLQKKESLLMESAGEDPAGFAGRIPYVGYLGDVKMFE